MRTVSEILKTKGPQFNYIAPTRTVLEAVSLMKAENISYLIVRENGNYLGIICERDYTHKVILLNKHSDTTLVKEIMSTDLPVVGLSDTTEECMMLMNSSKSRYLPVFEGFEFKGVITIHDLMREAIAASEKPGAVPTEHHEKLMRDYWI
ncbi:CBS domain-containing protein [Panacibacter ginsenosidivorans]|uniref:CBS domain-containing protein n=1 Tax=Panacibacter ginsenosidivorans TaxID=1813871 RepID=A0A5B8VEH0_9BACT|nr:CBS domain-containing protein [Panacibacter ginsenosidivorans]QEC69026.1 CBS domain-containing protein [Panacibacter ginsenosidivorans]